MIREAPISFSSIAIDAVAAATPAFADIASLFRAWADGDAPAHPTLSADLHMLITQATRAISPSHSRDTGLLFATTKGDIAAQTSWMRQSDAFAAAVPASSPPTLGSSLDEILQRLHLTGPAHVVSTACTSGLTALIDSAILLAAGDAPTMIALGADIATDFIHDGFNALRALSPTRCAPFDRDRDGLALGSAAAACRLTISPATDPLAFITGFGVSNDATHMTAPDRNAGGLLRAIDSALAMARLRPPDIDVIFAHGTGTRYNDAMEALAIAQRFPLTTAVTAIKGLIGHTLGASGLIESALAVEMLRTGTIPPIIGLRVPESDRVDFVTSTRRRPLRHVLKIASGFGGMNAAIIFTHPHHVPHRPARSNAAPAIHVRRAANADANTLQFHPPQVLSPSGLQGGDALADIAVPALHALLHDLSPAERSAAGLILGTTLGCLEIDREFDRSRRDAHGRYASPAAFSRTLPSTVAAELALKFTLRGPSLVLAAGDASAAVAIRRAAQWMHAFDLDFCIAGALDWTGPRLPIPESLCAAFLLLARDPRGSIAVVDTSVITRANLRPLRDASLDALVRWIQHPAFPTHAFTPLRPTPSADR